MKHILTLSLIALSLTAQSQWGIKAGAQATAFIKGKERDLEPKVGFVGGIYDRIYLSKKFSLQPEFIYSSKGTLINHEPAWDRSRWREQFRMNLSYVQTGINANLHFNKTIAIHAGAYAAYMVRMNINKWNYDNQVTTFDENDFVRFDYGINAGFSLDLYGMIIESTASYGFPYVGKSGRPLGWREANRAFSNGTISVCGLIPFKIHK